MESHDTEAVWPGLRRTGHFGRSTWASARLSRANGRRATTKETRQRAFCGRRANHAGIFFLKSDYSHTPAAYGTPTMRTARGRVLFASCVPKKNTNNTSQRMFSCIRIGCRTWRRRARKRWNCSRVRESSSTVKRCYGGFHAFASASWVRSLGFRAKRNKHCRFGEV